MIRKLEKALIREIKEGIFLKGGVRQALKSMLETVKTETDSDYVVLTVWDVGREIPFIHEYISSNNLVLPPAKISRGPMGICMEKGEIVAGLYKSFPKILPELSDKLGYVVCLPLNIPGENLVGSLGLGRVLGKPEYKAETIETLRAVANYISLIVSLQVFRDLLEKEKRILEAFSLLLSSVLGISKASEKYETILRTTAGMFDAQYGLLGKIDTERKCVVPLLSLGFEAKKEIPFGKGFTGKIAESGHSFFFENYAEVVKNDIPEGYEDLKEKIGSVFGITVFVWDKPSYVFAIARSKQKPPFDKSDYYFFCLIADVLNLIFTLIKYEEEKEKFISARRRIERVEVLSSLAGGMAHDFNNIINVIMGYAQIGKEMCKPGADIKELENCFSVIVDQCKRAASLTQQVLSISRGETVEKQVVDLKNIVKNVAKLLRRVMPEDIEVIYEDSGEDAYYVWGNPTQIHRMLLNLASNAQDAMPNGGKFILRLKKCKKPQGWDIDAENLVVLIVEDTGKGIDPAILPRIFDPFFTTKEVGKGTGLGLLQVHRTIKEMNGMIDVSSKVGEGTKFVFYIPEAKPETGISEKLESITEKNSTKTALVIEDNEDMLRILELMLKKLGVKAISYSDPEKALEEFDAFKDSVDLVITDVVMPKLSGIEVAEKLIEKKKDLRIIFITGYTDRIVELRELADKLKASILAKPFTLEELSETLKNI